MDKLRTSDKYQKRVVKNKIIYKLKSQVLRSPKIRKKKGNEKPKRKLYKSFLITSFKNNY